MKAELRSVVENGVSYKALLFVCPGCVSLGAGSGLHMLAVNSTTKTPSWDWNEDGILPTLSPSILTRYSENGVCHSFLRNGIFEFLSDCTHSLAGQSVPMVDLPEWMDNYYQENDNE